MGGGGGGWVVVVGVCCPPPLPTTTQKQISCKVGRHTKRANSWEHQAGSSPRPSGYQPNARPRLAARRLSRRGAPPTPFRKTGAWRSWCCSVSRCSCVVLLAVVCAVVVLCVCCLLCCCCVFSFAVLGILYICVKEQAGEAGKEQGKSRESERSMTLAGLEPAIFGSEDQRLVH